MGRRRQHGHDGRRGRHVILTGIDADTIVSGGGDDVITLIGGADVVDTGAGFDRIVVDYSAMTSDVTGGDHRR
jgi:hypothetical protein